MPRVHTHYDNLKVARNAPPEVIRAAYKTLSQKYHPDRNGNNPDAIRVIQIINIAYAVLSDPGKRREHDEWIVRAEAHAETSHAPEFQDRVAPRQARGSVHRHSRRRTPFDFSGLSGMPRPSLTKALHRLCFMLDQFSRKLFGKT